MSRTTPFHTAPRLFVDNDLGDAQHIVLSPDQTHYLSHVLRLQEGDSVRLFNGRDGEWESVIASSGKNKKRVLTLTPRTQTRLQTKESALFLICAPIKKAHFDDILMKATELGVTCFLPILTTRTQIREVNVDRCRAICVEAAEQSERLTVPTIAALTTLENLVKTWAYDALPVVCAEWGDAVPVGQALLHQQANKAAIITGPEGGFTAEELAFLHNLPEAISVRLGPRILRADTAAVAALTCWQALCGDWRESQLMVE